MRIAFVVARIGNERNVIQKLSLVLANELNRHNDLNVDVLPFTKKQMFNIFSYRKFRNYDAVLIANIGLHCAYFSIWKRLGMIAKPFIAISFGSDIRATKNKLINLFNRLSKPTIDLLIVVNPDLVEIAKNRGYANIEYVPSWGSALD